MSRVITEKVEITDKMLKPSKRLIDVDDLIKIIDKYYDADECNGSDVAMDIMSDISSLPSAQPDYIMNEWCTDCKEYDHEKHCCPRFNKVIRTALQDAQPEIIRCKDCAKREYCRTSTVWAMPPKDDWFCADAERRTDEQTDRH